MTTRVASGDPDDAIALPPPGPAFHWTAETWGYALRCRPLSASAQHLFTTKQLRLRPSTGSGRPEIPEGRADASAAFGWTQAVAAVGSPLDRLMRVKQVHGAQVRVLKKGAVGPGAAMERPDGDAIVSNAPGFVLAVQVADCVPILIADRRTGAAAAVHAGWRGTCAGITRATVRALIEELAANPADMVAAIGPSIGPCCYTVGKSVSSAFVQAGAVEAEIDRWFATRDDGSLTLDLWTANRDQLVGGGLFDENVHTAGLCTQSHREVFESYRVDGERAGRMAGLIAVP
jgi:polyphenol oxidase